MTLGPLIVPAFYAAVIVTAARHGALALFAPPPKGASPRNLLHVRRLPRSYYRSAISLLPSCLRIVGITAAGAASLFWRADHPVVACLLAGGFVGGSHLPASRLDAALWHRHFTRHSAAISAAAPSPART